MTRTHAKGEPFLLGGAETPRGSRRLVRLPVARIPTGQHLDVPVHVLHGAKPGPTAFVSAALHGDELGGVASIRDLLQRVDPKSLTGTLLAIPVINGFGVIHASRYLPDRRDLNRSFPGSASGSLAARLASLFLNEVVVRCDVGVDLHSAAIHRTNLPQIRVSPGRPNTMMLAEAFGAPLILTSKLRDGSLRQAALDREIDILLYEAGEGLRFDENAVRTGVTGILRVMRHLGMISGKQVSKPKVAPIRSTSSNWQRAPAGGLLRTYKTIGEAVSEGDVLGVISDPFGETETEILSEDNGLMIGRTNLPIVNEGDGLFHIARIRKSANAEATIDSLASQLDADPLFDEDEII